MIYNINFLNESISRQQPINEMKTFIDDIHVVNENALYIKNLDSFVTPSKVISDLEDIKSKATDKKEIERIDANIEKIKTALSKAESDNELVQK